jgi:hypothetical protein
VWWVVFNGSMDGNGMLLALAMLLPSDSRVPTPCCVHDAICTDGVLPAHTGTGEAGLGLLAPTSVVLLRVVALSCCCA